MKDSGATRIDLDDSLVLQVRREQGVVMIDLEQRRGITTKHIAVVALGVTREDAEYYVGHNVTAPHPDPTLPLDYIEFAEQAPGYIELGGYLKNESWFVWRICSADIEIKYEASE